MIFRPQSIWRRVLRRRMTHPTPIAELGAGRVIVEGEVMGRAARNAPISGRPAIGFRLLIERESGVRGWVPVHDHAEYGEFELRDASGGIRVRTDCGAIELEAGEHGGEGGPFRPLPSAIVELVTAHMSVRGVVFHMGFRWREWVLEPAAAVRVRGSVVSEACESEPIGYREFGRALVLTGGAGAPLEIWD